MADRYNTTHNLEAQYEPGSDGQVLKNKLGIQDKNEMHSTELDFLDRFYGTIPEKIKSAQVITIEDLKEWHRQWLGGIYDWAGQYRTVNMSKEDFPFAAATQIERLMSDLDRKFLSQYTPCSGMTDEQLAEAIAIVHVELILIHPFREGNGRLARILANFMAMQAGKPELDFPLWDKKKINYFSAIRAGLDDYEPMKKLVRQVLFSGCA